MDVLANSVRGRIKIGPLMPVGARRKFCDRRHAMIQEPGYSETMETTQHDAWLRRCLMLGAKGCGFVGSGAMVGSVLVRNGAALAENYHPAFGRFHAERMLLTEFKDEIQSSDTLYVNLEPCVPSPTKKTPACVDIILERGVKRVVYGMVDPDARVAGRGVEFLRSRGVMVEGPGLDEESRRFNRGFVSLRSRDRPWCAAISSPSAIEPFPAGAAWSVTNEPQPFAAFMLDVAELSSLRTSHFVTGAIDAPEQRPRLIVLDPDRSMGEQQLIDLARNFRPIVLSETVLRVIGPQSVISDIPLSSGATNTQNLLKTLGTPCAQFPGVSAVVILSSNPASQALSASGRVDETIR